MQQAIHLTLTEYLIHSMVYCICVIAYNKLVIKP